MFEFAVIGSFAGNRLGVVRQCIECRAAAGVGAPACPGFGPGCLVHRPVEARLQPVAADGPKARR